MASDLRPAAASAAAGADGPELLLQAEHRPEQRRRGETWAQSLARLDARRASFLDDFLDTWRQVQQQDDGAGWELPATEGTAEQVAALEDLLGLQLPHDYRLFLREVGWTKRTQMTCPWAPASYKIGDEHGARARGCVMPPFPFSETFTDGKFGRVKDATHLPPPRKTWGDGLWPLFPLNSDGAVVYLVLAGEQRGRVWALCDHADGFAAAPCERAAGVLGDEVADRFAERLAKAGEAADFIAFVRHCLLPELRR
jgi:hypothetical protein